MWISYCFSHFENFFSYTKKYFLWFSLITVCHFMDLKKYLVCRIKGSFNEEFYILLGGVYIQEGKLELIAIYDYFLADQISQFGSNGNFLFVTGSICRFNTSDGYVCDKKTHSRFSPSTWHLSAIIRYGTKDVSHKWKNFVALLKTKYKPCCMNVF